MAKRNAKSIPDVRYSIEPTPEGMVFLADPHPQRDIARRVLAKLWKKFEYLEAIGPYLEYPHARKLYGYDGLYELRVEDESGWYRVFYGFGPPAGGVIPIGIVGGIVKKERNLPDAEYKRAETRLMAWKASLRR